MSQLDLSDSDEGGDTSIETETIQRIDLNTLNIDPENVRGVEWHRDSEDEELVESIEANGVHSPLLVRPVPDGMEGNVEYTIMAGGRRFNAAVEAGLSEVPCVVKDVDDVTAAGISVSENRDRKDVPAYREVFMVIDHFQRMDEDMGKTEKVAELADTFGTSESTVHRYLNIGVLPEEARELTKPPSDRAEWMEDYLKTQTDLNRVPDTALSTQKAAQLSRNLHEVQRGGGSRVPTIAESEIAEFAARSVDERTEGVANASELLGENSDVSMDQAWEAARKARIEDIEVGEAHKTLTDHETDSEESEENESREPTDPTQDSTEGIESDAAESDDTDEELEEDPDPADDWNSPPVSISTDPQRYDLSGVPEGKRDEVIELIGKGDLQVRWVSPNDPAPDTWVELDPPQSDQVVYQDE